MSSRADEIRASKAMRRALYELRDDKINELYGENCAICGRPRDKHRPYLYGPRSSIPTCSNRCAEELRQRAAKKLLDETSRLTKP